MGAWVGVNGIGLAGIGSINLESKNKSFLLVGFASLGAIDDRIDLAYQNPQFFHGI